MECKLTFCNTSQKVVNGLRRNFMEGWKWPKKRFGFGGDPDHSLDPGFLDLDTKKKDANGF